MRNKDNILQDRFGKFKVKIFLILVKDELNPLKNETLQLNKIYDTFDIK